MKRKEKEIIVSQLSEELKKKKNFFFTSFQGVKTEEINQLRRHLAELSWEYRVVKNILYQRIFKNLELENVSSAWLGKFFHGPTALLLEKNKKISSFGVAVPEELSKVLISFIKGHPNFKINAGFIAGRVLSSEEIINLAKLPSREVLLTQLVKELQFPFFRLVNILQGPLRKFIYLLHCKNKEKRDN